MSKSTRELDTEAGLETEPEMASADQLPNAEISDVTAEINESLENVAQVEWVKRGIEARYERSLLVNAPLLALEEVPQFPSVEATLRSALKHLTREQVAYMMKGNFVFQMKLVTPSHRLDLQEVLLNGQPRKMDTSEQDQQDLFVSNRDRELLAGKLSPEKMEWKWEFVQTDQVEDDVSLELAARLEQIKKNRPAGMRGLDRYSWATLMADSLERGEPLDIRFVGGAKDTPEHEQWNYTVLDEEGEFLDKEVSHLICGNFGPDSRRARLSKFRAGKAFPDARFRSSIDGSIEV